MSTDGFVVFAKPSALRRAEALGVAGVLESRTEAAIRDGAVVGQGAQRLVRLDDGFVVHVTRLDETTPGRRRKLLVTRVEPARSNDNRGGGR